MNRTYRETDGIGVVGDDGERGLAPVVAASVIAEVFQICRAGFGRNIGRDASVSAMCVNWRAGQVGGHPLTVNPAYLTAKLAAEQLMKSQKRRESACVRHRSAPAIRHV